MVRHLSFGTNHATHLNLSSMKQLIRIGVVDDHTLFRKSFIQALSGVAHFSVILDSADGNELLDKLPLNLPDVLLLDVRMPKPDGFECLTILNEKFPSVRVLILSAFLDEVYVTKAIEFGVLGYLSKSMDMQQLEQAIEYAYANKVYTNNLLTNSFLR